MITNLHEFAELSDRDLLATVHRLAADERHATASLIASLAELDERRLYLPEGYSSLFTYCTQVLRLSEHAAYGKLAQVSRPQRPRGTKQDSRHIPSAVRRAVWLRDNGQCAFTGARGRCAERGFLEFHHVVPFAHGGTAVVDNIQLRCRAHNQYESYQLFGTPEPPVVRERRDFSRWSNSVRTESHIRLQPGVSHSFSCQQATTREESEYR